MTFAEADWMPQTPFGWFGPQGEFYTEITYDYYAEQYQQRCPNTVKPSIHAIFCTIAKDCP